MFVSYTYCNILSFADHVQSKVGIVERVTFDTSVNERSTSYLQIENDGTTAVYYEWQKKPKVPSFEDMKLDTIQRFYFNTGEGNDLCKMNF